MSIDPRRDTYLEFIAPDSLDDINLLDGQDHGLRDVGCEPLSSGSIGVALSVVSLGVILGVFEVVSPPEALRVTAEEMTRRIFEDGDDVRFRARQPTRES